MIRMTLATKLKEFRTQAGLTINEVGDRIGKSGKTVSAWECGRGQPDADMLLALCELYGVSSISEFYGEAQPAVPYSIQAQKIAAAYEKATAKEKKLIDLILADYMQDIPAPVRVAAMSNGGEVDLSSANPDAPLSTGFKSGPDIP